MDITHQIKDSIFDNIRSHELYGKINLWQDHMIKEVVSLFPKEYKSSIERVINDLISKGILEYNENGYLFLTEKGEEIVYKSDYYSVDRLKDKIFRYLRENNYFAGSRWPILTAHAYCEKELVVYEKRLFNKTIQSMIEDNFFDVDEINRDYILTKKCQGRMYSY